MSLFALAGLSLGVLCLLLAVIVLLYAKQKLHRLWALFNIVVALWGLGTYLAGISQNSSQAIQSWRIAYLPCTFIAIVFYNLICTFCNINRRKMMIFSYIQGVLFLPLIYFSKYFINSTIFLFNSIHYHKATLLFEIWMAIFVFIACSAFFELFKFIKVSQGVKRTQALYLFWGMALGWAGGLTTLLPPYNLNIIYPAWHFTICIYTFLMSYAIFRYQIMDIRVAITRVTIFALVYTLVLGFPFGIIFWGKNWLINTLKENWFWMPMLMVTVLATVGPFIYLYIQKRAEDRLLQEQRRYQATLRQASAGMGKIKDLRKLLNMIVYVLTHAIQIEHATVYVYDVAQKQYILGAAKRKLGYNQFANTINEKSPLVQYLISNKNPHIYEEIKQRAEDYKDLKLIQIAQSIFSLQGALVVPIFIDQDLTAIIVMGKKESGKTYSEDDLAVFSILANQTALAIENAKFYEDMKLTHDQLFQAEKMATIGTMADGLSHQINNRFHALGFIAGDALDTIRLNQNELTQEKMKEVLTELDRAFVRVQENVVQGGEIVQGLLKYTRKGEAGFTAVEVPAVFKSALEMAQFKIKTDQLKIIHDYDPASIPKIKGNFTQLQEVFFNLIDNGYDAMMQRKSEQKEPNYQPTLIVRVLKEDAYAQVIFEDNGMGVKDDDMHKLFTPFFTTKLSSKKGTGLGLYVIKKIVEDNHDGRVEMVSKYTHGTQMKLRLPIAIE